MRRCLTSLMGLCLTLMLSWLVPPALIAQESGAPVVDSASLALRDGYWRLDADFAVSLTPPLQQAAERGLPLQFTVDLEVTRSRWWWFDQTELSASRVWTISHHALTRQWRVSGGGLALPVATLDEALALVSTVRDWSIAPAGRLDPKENLSARVRLRLDVSQLSRPLQVNALSSSAWSLASPWQPVPVEAAP